MQVAPSFTKRLHAGRLSYRLPLSVLCLLFAVSFGHAEDLNLKETPETTSVSLSPFSFGAEIGGLFALNSELRDQNEAYLELGVATSILFAEQFAVGLHYDWFIPGSSQGGGLTLDYLLGSGAFRPFIGAGLGLHYSDNGQKFGDAFGIAGAGHIGLIFDVLDELQLRIRAPLILVGNNYGDKLAGLDFALLFSGPHRKTKVKKLTY